MNIPVGTFPHGEIFGEAAVLPRPLDYLVSSEAMANRSALVWSRDTIRGFCERSAVDGKCFVDLV
jgi:hypothetical protein